MEKPSYAAFHVLWTKPYTIKGKLFSMKDAEILTMIISALMWQLHNGTIKLYTDNVGMEFIKDKGLLSLWDGGIDTKVLENNDYPIEPEIFWAAGKLIALEAHSAPCVMLDTDLIVVRSINELLLQTSLAALHTEVLEPNVYLNPTLLKHPKGFKFPKYYNWEVLPSNTSFLYIQDESFKNYYLKESKKFMFNNTDKPAELVSQMVFAEQRLFSICAKNRDLNIDYLLTNPFSLSNNAAIHLWGFKSVLRQSESAAVIYSKQLIKTFRDQLSTNSSFQSFVEKYIYNINS